MGNPIDLGCTKVRRRPGGQPSLLQARLPGRQAEPVWMRGAGARLKEGYLGCGGVGGGRMTQGSEEMKSVESSAQQAYVKSRAPMALLAALLGFADRFPTMLFGSTEPRCRLLGCSCSVFRPLGNCASWAYGRGRLHHPWGATARPGGQMHGRLRASFETASKRARVLSGRRRSRSVPFRANGRYKR